MRKTAGPLLKMVVLMLLLPGIGSGKTVQEVLPVGDFSSFAPGENLPSSWEPMIFEEIERHTRYSLVPAPENGATVLKAESKNSVSGLIRKIRIDPRRYPILRWRWRVTRIFPEGNVRKKSGDDYPARIYISFEYDPDKLSLFQRVK